MTNSRTGHSTSCCPCSGRNIVKFRAGKNPHIGPSGHQDQSLSVSGEHDPWCRNPCGCHVIPNTPGKVHWVEQIDCVENATPSASPANQRLSVWQQGRCRGDACAALHGGGC